MAKVNFKNVVIKGVSSPSSIMLIAQERNIDPSEVFVRIAFEHEGEEYKASNKLKYLKKTGYEKLVKAVADETPIDILFDAERNYFDIDYGFTIDSLFSKSATNDVDSVITKPKDRLDGVMDKLDDILGG